MTPSHTPPPMGPPTPISCARCQGRFDVVMPDTPQGYGCSCNPIPEGIAGGYGSVRHDMRSYTVRQPHLVPTGTLCDGCMDVLLDSGAITQDPPAPPPPFKPFPPDLDDDAIFDLLFADLPTTNAPSPAPEDT